MQDLGDQALEAGGAQRKVSPALEAYALLATSAARGRIRDIEQLRR